MHCEYGEVIHTLPQGFAPKEQWPEYHVEHNPPPSMHPELVGTSPRGVRWGVWPLMFEEYVSDLEPDLNESRTTGRATNRIVQWRRLTRTNKPPGWHTFSKQPSRLEGFAEITDGNFVERWDESARRYRKKWLEQHLGKTHAIELVSYDQFEAAYLPSIVGKKLQHVMIAKLKKTAAVGPQVEFAIARDLNTGTPMAGISVINSPSCQASYYAAGFVHHPAEKTPAMVGLMEYWFLQCQRRGLHHLHFGEFWMPGKPKKWKGFSSFKAKFGLQYIHYPPMLWRVVRGNLF